MGRQDDILLCVGSGYHSASADWGWRGCMPDGRIRSTVHPQGGTEAMQFRLITLFIATAAVAVVCGLITSAPPVLAIPVFCVMLWLAPAFWIGGVVYARGIWRAFFIGGVAVGAIPYLTVVVYGSFLSLYWVGGVFGTSLGPDNRLVNLIAASIVFAPIVLALFGGWITMAVHVTFQPSLQGTAGSPFKAN
jgi:hypothetical protein